MARRSVADVERRLRDQIKAADEQRAELENSLRELAIRRLALSDALALVEETDDDPDAALKTVARLGETS